MRKFFVLIAAAAALAGSAMAKDVVKAPAVPRKAGEFVFKMQDGSQKLLSSYRGKTVVAALMFTTCPHCQKISELLSKIQTEYEPKGVQVVGAVFEQGARERMAAFVKDHHVNFPVGSSEQQSVLEFLQLPLSDPYFVPILVFIDKNGIVRSQYVGDEKFLSNQEVNIRAEIDKTIKAAGSPRVARAAPKP